MKSYKKMMITAAAVSLCLAVAVPTASYAEESDGSSSAGVSDALSGSLGDDITSEWVTDADGRIYYYDETGAKATGETEIDGELYLFSKNGVLKTGWRTVAGKRRYYNPQTGKPVYGRFTICGEEFCVEPEQGKIAGDVFTDENGDKYITSDKGALILNEGFVERDNTFFYVTSDGTLAVGETIINEIPYVFDENGEQQTGWVNVGEKTYYYAPDSGEIQLGLIDIDGSLYYVDENEGRKEGVVEIDGVEYLFAEGTGKLHTGLLEINGNIKYFYPDGKYASGVTEINGKNYLFSKEGNRLSGLQTFDGRLYHAGDDGILSRGMTFIGDDAYFFGEDSSAVTGIIDVSGAKYLFGNDFKMLTGKQLYNGKYYCFDNTSGKMLTGKILINEKKYYFGGDDGSMQTGWVELEDGKYYFGTDGSAVTGIYEVDGKKYYFHPDTSLMTTGRLIIDGKKYYFGENGAMVLGWVTLDDGKYYFSNDGVMVTGWKTISGKKYYFNKTNGKMETNKIVDDYNLTADGSAVPLSAVQKRAKTIISSIGKSPSAIYNYVCNNNKYRYIEDTRTLSQINAKGWSYFANYSLDNRYVVCYYFAAVTDLLFQQAGLKSRIVYGTGRGTGDHYWNQIYDAANDKWVNYDTCNGYSGVTFSYLQSQNYTFYQYVYPKFY